MTPIVVNAEPYCVNCLLRYALIRNLPPLGAETYILLVGINNYLEVI